MPVRHHATPNAFVALKEVTADASRTLREAQGPAAAARRLLVVAESLRQAAREQPSLGRLAHEVEESAREVLDKHDPDTNAQRYPSPGDSFILPSVLHEVLTALTPSLDKQGVHLLASIAVSRPVRGDADRFATALRSLLAHFAGRAAAVAGTRAIRIKLLDNLRASRLKLSISHSGIELSGGSDCGKSSWKSEPLASCMAELTLAGATITPDPFDECSVTLGFSILMPRSNL